MLNLFITSVSFKVLCARRSEGSILYGGIFAQQIFIKFLPLYQELEKQHEKSIETRNSLASLGAQSGLE